MSQSEINDFLRSCEEAKEIEGITRLVESEIAKQVELHLLNFQSAISDLNLAAIEIMQQELAELKAENATVKGAMERLKNAVAPDLKEVDEVVSFREAINNLERYGSIIPSSQDIAVARSKQQHSLAWSLFWQSIVKITIKKIQEKLDVRAIS